MRLLFVVHQFLPLHVTGTEQYVRSLALGLRERGHEVSVVAFEPRLNVDNPGQTVTERDDDVDGIPVRRIGIHLEVLPNRELADYQNPLAVRLLRRYLDENQFDVVHLFHLRYIGIGIFDELAAVGLPTVVNLMDFWFLCPSFILLRSDGALCEGPPDNGMGCIPCIAGELGSELSLTGLDAELRAHSAVSMAPPDLRTTPIRRASALVGRKPRLLQALQRASVVVAPSKFLRSVFEENGFPAGVLRHVPYGVDPGRFGGRRKVWGKSLSKRVEFGFVGSIVEHKGLHVLIEAIRKINGENWHLHVHGSLETHLDYSERIVQAVDGDSRITLHGRFEPDQLGSVLADLDLIVVPSLWYENTPFSVLEAQMMGLPVLASRLGGISESIVHGRNGFLFKAGSQSALTTAIRKILDDPEQLSGMELAGEVQTLGGNIAEFEALYAEQLVVAPEGSGS
ncbi:MAG: glycosyltransferase family 4 protein [Planctomycetota bacterium]|nr:glycosyltransferase family 4 protein [Planctomycetota bacterium]